MIQALAALLGAALTVAACYASGVLLLGRLGLTLKRAEQLPLAFILGAACFHLAVFAFLAAHIAYWPVLVALCLAPIAVSLINGSWKLSGEPEAPLSYSIKRLSIVLFGIFFLLYLFHAWAPEMSPDGQGYHLGYVSRYVHAHGFEWVTTNMYAALSGGVEMLFVPAFAVGRHSAAALVHFAFTVALALAILAYGRRLGKPWVGAAAAFLTFASPVVGIAGTSAYIDVAVGAIVFGAFYFLEIWDEGRNPAALIPVGLLAGYAYAAKYTAFVILPFALVFVLWRARKMRPAGTVFLYSIVMFAPWMLKDWIILKNPVAPFADTVFRTPYFHPLFEREYMEFLRSYGVTDMRTLPLEVTIRGTKTQGLIGMAFLGLPIALLALRYRAGRRLLACGVVVGATYFTNIGTRFLIPALPFFSLAMALALGEATPLLALLMVFHAYTSWPSRLDRTAAAGAWRLDDKFLYRQALRIVPQEQYLRQNDSGYGAAMLVDAAVPKGERVLALGEVPQAYTGRDILISYQSAFNEVLADIVNMGWADGFQARVADTFKFPERSANRLRVVQTANPGDPHSQWSVHELRFFDKGVELPRRPEWRLRAWPNPWDVQMAFDNSPATRWRSWEQASPGMYLDVDFGHSEMVDEVRMEHEWNYKTRAEVQSYEAGTWVKVAENPESTPIDPPAYLRKAATRELLARGVRYMLVTDDNYAASDIRDDPEFWGLSQIASGSGIRIYRVEP
jgi:F5/8 type C domain/Dolichyl-phosphate-mannose-protein mannosyltransferase